MNPIAKAVFGVARVTFEVCAHYWNIGRRRLGLYHHLLVGQAGKSFFERTLRVVFSGCGCVLRLRPSRFPFSGFFRRRRRASRRPRLSLTSHSPRTPFPLFHCPSLPLSPAFSAPLLLLTFLSCAALILCAFPPFDSGYIPRSSLHGCPATLAGLIFSRFSRLHPVNMRPRPVCLPSLVFPC